MRNIFCPIIMGGATNKIEQIVTFDEPGTHEWIVPDNVKSVDVFLVGGGGGGTLISAGGGGYTKTFRGRGYTPPAEGTWEILPDGGRDGNAIAVIPGENIQIIVGAGGAYSTGNNHASNGGYSQFKSSSYKADGGVGGYRVSGTILHSGDGGSGGSGLAPTEYGGSDGLDGSDKIGTKANGKGQGHTTRDFGELTGKRNSGGGGCGNNGIGGESDYEGGKGENATGSNIGSGGGGFGGGGGGCYTTSVRGGSGGSGVVKIRYFVKPVTKYDPLLNAFVNKAGISAFTEKELTATDSFIKSLRENRSLFNKLVWIHPYIGSNNLSRSLNLMNVNTYQITFSGKVTHDTLYTRYDEGMGKINIDTGLQANTNMMLALYVRNSIQLSCYDIGQEENLTNRQTLEICWPSLGLLYEVGNVTTGRVSASISEYNKFIVGNAHNSIISLWRDGVKLATKSSNIVYTIPNFVYNTYSFKNTREYAIGIMSHGLTDDEVTRLSTLVNNYMESLGRAI